MYIKLTLKREVSPLRTFCKYNCLTSFSSLLGKPGYIDEPPDKTMCL